jgi:carboxypeptidase Taq
MKPRDAYSWLFDHHVETSHLESAGSLLAWDQRTYLPPNGHPHRAKQLALMARLVHLRAIDPRIGERLVDVADTDLVVDKTSPEAVNAREWRRAYDRAIRIPTRLAEDLARATSEAETCWETARQQNDWAAFKPKLVRVLDLLREKAEAIGYKEEAYDALLEDYEPGQTTRALQTLFGQLKNDLVPLLERINASSVQPDTDILYRSFPVPAQKQFARSMAKTLGYDLRSGRIDTTAHPFTIDIGPRDIRITTRYFEDFFSPALFGTIHEAGHAMYEQGLQTEYWGTPLGKPISLGVHESQSRLWENMVGRSAGLWQYAFQSAVDTFDALAGPDVTLNSFLLAINAVTPSPIRVEADEVTYNLHILLRFEIELMLLRGDLNVDDLPDAWNEKMSEYLGLTPPDLASGVMQDVHWSAGLVGYFPTYTLGNLYAAQLFAKADQELGGLDEQFARGEFKPLLEWLRKNVHRHGSTYLPADLITQATGAPPDPQHFIRYLNGKYGRLYQFKP